MRPHKIIIAKALTLLRGVFEHPMTGRVMQFFITLDILTTTNAKTLKLIQDMH